MIESLPEAFFVVDAPPPACRLRSRDDVPARYREHLAAHRPDYDTIQAEALRRMEKLGPADALKALSSLVEENPGDAAIASDAGYSAMAWGLTGQAWPLFRRVAEARPWEPQAFQAMARCLEALGRDEMALALDEIVFSARWDARFSAVRPAEALNYVRLLRRVSESGRTEHVRDFARSRLASPEMSTVAVEAGLVVEIAWTTDGTDVDLHVVEPAGERCWYRNITTKIGGRISPDVTTGFGPEVYLLPGRIPGRYRVEVQSFATDAIRASVRTKVFVSIYERWGTPEEKVTRKVVTLDAAKETQEVASFIVEKSVAQAGAATPALKLR